ncbi:MAG TPA: Stp1/IreP family PP2C-type Ser/Thr phosphatase [Acidimicrobiales bacterium]|nr:Stp1/IreP family PP2C-type Ser/Thr phosphatase [Acidimicrobiales bacterium]
MTGSGSAGGVRLRWGGASDVGQVRQVNQDSMFLGSAIFVVADGMGGHAGGEVASRLTVETIEEELEANPSPGLRRVLDLVTAVQAANDRVWEESEQDPSLAGMGTTVVAIGLVEEAGETRLAIVNVGDSRAYRLSDGNLDQISEDHSLVGELYREGRISADEAQHHPQKNIVTRAVGIERFVDVDEFQVLPRTGDRYLLCSDGLTDEVGEAEIADVLRTVDDPDEAAQLLVQQANRNGGRDNITVVVVDVLDDGLDGRVPVPDAEDFSEHPDHDTQSLSTVPDDEVRERIEQPTRPAPPPTPPSADTDRADRSAAADAPRQRALTARSAAFVIAVLALVGVGAYLAERYATDTYHVALDGDEVAIYQGRPGGFLWWEAELVDRTGIDLDDVPPSVLDDLEAGVSQPSLARARRYVTNLEDRIEASRPPVTTTTTTSTTSTTAPAPPAAPSTTGVAPG